MRNKAILAMLLVMFSFLASPACADTTFTGERIDPCEMAVRFPVKRNEGEKIRSYESAVLGRDLEACAETLPAGDNGTVTARMCATYFSAANSYEDAARDGAAPPNKFVSLARMVYHAHAYELYFMVATGDCGKTLMDQAKEGADKASELMLRKPL
jgi:hypothetical protein